MPDLGLLVEFGPRLKVLLANPTPTSRLRLDLPLRAVMEVRGGVRRQGTTFEPRLVYETRETGSPWGYDASVAAVFGDSRINRYFYEVAPQYATPARPAYSAGAGLMLMRVGLSAIVQVQRRRAPVRLRAPGKLRRRGQPRQPADEEGRSGASIGGGFAWTLGRSAPNARRQRADQPARLTDKKSDGALRRHRFFHLHRSRLSAT